MSMYNVIASVNRAYPNILTDGWVDFNRNGKKEYREMLRDIDNDGEKSETDYYFWIGANQRHIQPAIRNIYLESQRILASAIINKKNRTAAMAAAKAYMDRNFDPKLLKTAQIQELVNKYLIYMAELGESPRGKDAKDFLVWLDGMIIPQLKKSLTYDDAFYKQFIGWMDEAKSCESNGRRACDAVVKRFNMIRKVRLAALYAIEGISGKKAFLLFTDVLGDFTKLREIGAKFIGKYGVGGRVKNAFVQKVKQDLIKLAREDRSASVRWEAMMALAKMNERPAIQMLMNGLRSRNEGFRLKTIRALAEMRYKPANRALIKIVKNKKEKNLFVVEALKALIKIGDKSIIPMLIKLTDDNRRAESLECYLRDGKPRKIIDRMIGEDDFAFDDDEAMVCTVKEAAICGLRKFRKESVPALIEIVRRDGSEKTREKIANILKGIDILELSALEPFLDKKTKPVQLRWLAEDVLKGD